MIYVLNKKRLLSYILTCSFVLMLFAFQDSIITNRDVELVKVSTNVMENENINNEMNNINVK